VTDDDVRVLVQLVVYCDVVIRRDGQLPLESWRVQLGDDEQAALQRLVDELGI